MIAYKCKMCGGNIDFEEGSSVCTCEYCGTKQTLPRLDDERKANLYDRANHFRRSNDYDKAMAIYEQILNEDGTDAESYWSIILCRYGIEYVNDPATHKMVPTINRTQFDPVLADEDYKKALEYADAEQKIIYEKEAAEIDDILKGILDVSRNEEPFDVFICYKETDNNGRRTMDSVLANDLYHQLTQEGFKVFFSRITLEDKLGTAYEPYIFAALNSAKVMVVLGTRPEYFKAVWVKNEWSRYLSLIKKGEKKILIPSYKDMDPYDLPEEFSHLQAQDMGKLGYMQDLIRGIKKITCTEEPKQAAQNQPAQNVSGPTCATYLKRGNISLEDGEWEKAKGFFDDALNLDPECAEAYLGLAMADNRIDYFNLDESIINSDDIATDSNYLKALRFASDELWQKIDNWDKARIKRRTNERLEVEKEEERQIAEQKRREIEAEERIRDLDRQLNELYTDPKIWTSEKVVERQRLQQDYENTWHEMKRTRDEVNELESAIREKSAYHDSLGKFKGREKKRVFSEIAGMIGEKQRLENHCIECYETFIAAKDRRREYIDKVIYSQGKAVLGELLRMTICVGASVWIGQWPDGKDVCDIEWLVIGEKPGKFLLLSKDVIDKQPFNEDEGETTWQDCSLRKWLNEDFYVNAFRSYEKDMISSNYNIAHRNPLYDSDQGSGTTDRVFLLSIKEAYDYLEDDKARIGRVSAYSKKLFENSNAKRYMGSDGSISWWLRSTGAESDRTAFVKHSGEVQEGGAYPYAELAGVRPAIWISIE